MKQKRSIDEALTAAKQLRKKMSPAQATSQAESNSHLKVVETASNTIEEMPNIEWPQGPSPASKVNPQTDALATNLKPIWVRHTIGLRDTTSLSLRDAADGQKRKERHGQLQLGEPANEQEIADLGITLALRQLGYLE